MASAKHEHGEVAQGLANYKGHHREHDMDKGTGLIPVGDRNRAITEFGVTYIEERDSIDYYTRRPNKSA
jgi:hypothetical protein